jgi:hypothetical protein
MTIAQVHLVLERCKFPGYSWRVHGEFTEQMSPTYLQACFIEAREQFTYRGQNIFGPHFNVEALVDLRKAKLLEVRA